MKAIESVLLDFDGTLLDSNGAHAVAWKEYLKAATGLDLPVGRVALMIGMGGDKIIRQLFGDRHSDSQIKNMTEKRDEHYLKTQMTRMKPVAGAVEFTGELARRGFQVAIASSARHELLDPALKLVPIQPYVVGFSTPDEAPQSKPSPDIFLAAMKKFSFDPNRTAVIGDSPYDMQAGRDAGCKALVAVLSGHFSSADLSIADVVYKDVDELRRLLGSSILMR
ncbi:MAG: HAD family hydrolase [Candidatus Sumerlaeaceae bacterium]